MQFRRGPDAEFPPFVHFSTEDFLSYDFAHLRGAHLKRRQEMAGEKGQEKVGQEELREGPRK